MKLDVPSALLSRGSTLGRLRDKNVFTLKEVSLHHFSLSNGKVTHSFAAFIWHFSENSRPFTCLYYVPGSALKLRQNVV